MCFHPSIYTSIFKISYAVHGRGGRRLYQYELGELQSALCTDQVSKTGLRGCLLNIIRNDQQQMPVIDYRFH